MRTGVRLFLERETSLSRGKAIQGDVPQCVCEYVVVIYSTRQLRNRILHTDVVSPAYACEWPWECRETRRMKTHLYRTCRMSSPLVVNENEQNLHCERRGRCPLCLWRMNSYLKRFDTQMGVHMIGQLNRGFERSIAVGTFEKDGKRGIRCRGGSCLHLCGRSVECDLRCRCRRYFFVVV
jgi:hypothetical protein